MDQSIKQSIISLFKTKFSANKVLADRVYVIKDDNKILLKTSYKDVESDNNEVIGGDKLLINNFLMKKVEKEAKKRYDNLDTISYIIIIAYLDDSDKIEFYVEGQTKENEFFTKLESY